MIGTTLAHYEIRARIGTGGMGEVYRAYDTRLEREVAIKVLPEHLSESPELRQRLEREARVVSSLQHPRPSSPIRHHPNLLISSRLQKNLLNLLPDISPNFHKQPAAGLQELFGILADPGNAIQAGISTR